MTNKAKFTDHVNSKVVTIFRSGSFLERSQGADAAEFLAMGTKSIGSYFQNEHSQKVATGLTFDEEALLLPELIDTPADDRDFRKKLTDFYAGLSVKIPAEGFELQIGLSTDNTKPLGERNRPLSTVDYVRYMMLKDHPWVAPNKEKADGQSRYNFYIFDPTSIQSRNKRLNKEKDVAIANYLTIKDDSTKVDMLLTLLGTDVREFQGSDEVKTQLKQEALRTIADKNAMEFNEVFTERDFEVRYLIKHMVNLGILKPIGQRYQDTETRKFVGNSLDEVIAFFSDETNSEEIILYKSRIQEHESKPIQKSVRRTELNFKS